jgi:hypothetical protein
LNLGEERDGVVPEDPDQIVDFVRRWSGVESYFQWPVSEEHRLRLEGMIMNAANCTVIRSNGG